MSHHVLLVDDDREMCSLVKTALDRKGFTITTCQSGEEALAALAGADFEAVATDLNMRGVDGLELCRRIVQDRRDVPVIVITAFGSIESAVAALRAGAYDFITKPFEMELLRLTLERAVGHHALTAEVSRLRRTLAETQQFEGILGASVAMRAVYDLVDRVAETDASVLVSGESGTGKELVARAIHQRSRRRAGPFVAVNCAAMPEALLESELFGHVRGAFTDARTARAGLFVQADGGTLFLDEIGELPLALQPKLLRALQERRVRPVGGDTEVAFDARIVSATNRDLEGAVEEHRFRDDLFYRINVVHVQLPPLRARGGDILLLAQHFLERFAALFGRRVQSLSPAAAEKLLNYSWPGNVRELANSIERAVALSREPAIGLDDLPERVRDHGRAPPVLMGGDAAELVPLDEVERRYILHVLEVCGGNRGLAAQTLRLDRKTLYRKLKSYGVGEG